MQLSRSDRQISEWLFLLTLFTVGYFYAGGGWNQNAQFDLTRAIVERHTLAIDWIPVNTGDVSRYGSHVYANKAPGLSFLGAIPYAAILAVEHGRYPPGDPLILGANVYVCTVATAGLLVALVPFLLYREARRRGFPAAWSAVVALAVVPCTELFAYSTMFVAQVPSASLLFIAVVLASRESPRAQFAAGICAGAAGVTNYLCIPAAIVIALLAAWRSSARLLPLLRVTAGGAPFAILLAVYQKRCCGGAFTTPISTMDPRFVSKGAAFGILKLPSFEALYGITISPYRGLFYFSPLLLMGLVGLIAWGRSAWKGKDIRPASDRAEVAAITVITIFFFTFNASFNNWEGGFGIGARYLVPLIPLWGLAMLRCRGWLRPLLVVLAAVSFAINLTATAVDPQPSGTIPAPLTQYLVPLLIDGHFSPDVPITAPWSAATFTGHTSVNRFTHDEPDVFFRNPPGSAAAEWASFNLGEPFFGAGDARSLIPLVAILGFGAAAILVKARQVPRSSEETAAPTD